MADIESVLRSEALLLSKINIGRDLLTKVKTLDTDVFNQLNEAISNLAKLMKERKINLFNIAEVSLDSAIKEAEGVIKKAEALK